MTGIRFYKGLANTGTHVGSLWNDAGELLASATFSSETRQRLAAREIRQPRSKSSRSRPTWPATWRPNGHYSATPLAFCFVGTSNAPLEALASPISSNGVFAESATSTFPTSSGNGTNYWVDVDFVPMPVPGQVTDVKATAGARVGEPELGSARPKAAPSASTRSPPTSARKPSRRRRSRARRRPPGRPSPAWPAAPTTRSSCRPPTPTGAASTRRRRTPVTPTGSTPPSTPTAVSAAAANRLRSSAGANRPATAAARSPGTR